MKTAQAVNQGHAISVDYGEGDKPKESMKHYFDGEMGLHDKATLESLINNDKLSMLAARLIADGNAQDEVVEYADKGVLVEIRLKSGVTWRARNGKIGRVKMKMNVGSIYSAHAFDGNNERITGQGYYHFKLLYSLPRWHRTNASRDEIFLGLKIDVGIDPNNFVDSQCFWFNSDGVCDNGYIRFELKRRLYNKTYYEPKR